MNSESIVPVHAGASQLLSALCDEFGIERILNQILPWDQAQWKQSPGTHVKALIINALCAKQPFACCCR